MLKHNPSYFRWFFPWRILCYSYLPPSFCYPHCIKQFTNVWKLINIIEKPQGYNCHNNKMHIIYGALQYIQNKLLIHILQLPLQFAIQISALIADLPAKNPSQLGHKLNIHWPAMAEWCRPFFKRINTNTAFSNKTYSCKFTIFSQNLQQVLFPCTRTW